MLQAERAAQQRAEEAAERAALMEQYAAADRVEQLGAQRARLKVAEHRREVEALLATKRTAFEQEQVCCTYGCELHRIFLRFLGWIEPAVYMVAISTTSYYTMVPASSIQHRLPACIS